MQNESERSTLDTSETQQMSYKRGDIVLYDPGKTNIVCTYQGKHNGLIDVARLKNLNTGNEINCYFRLIRPYEGKIKYKISFKGNVKNLQDLGHMNVEAYGHNVCFTGTPKEFDDFYDTYLQDESCYKVIGVDYKIL